ncbi:MAG: hypothetical protein ACHQ7N_02505 [Candidatus Methylomirabilales bacterium]
MKWMRWIRAGLLAFLGISLSACAANGGLGRPSADPTPYPPPGLAHQVSSSAVELFWNCAHPQSDTLRLEGIAFNPWYATEIRFLEFDLVGIDAHGATVSETSGAAQQLQFGTMRSTPFELTLRTTGSEVRFDLFYQYQFHEPGDGGGDGNRMGERRPAGVPPVRLVSSSALLLAQANIRFLARDVCSDTQHRAR